MEFNSKKADLIVSGANGFTGRYVCLELIKRNIKFDVLIRKGNDTSWFEEKNINFHLGDLNHFQSLRRIFSDYSSLINVASIGFGSAPIILKACYESNINRAVFISTTSIFTKINSQSKSVRLDAEKAIKESKINWTIIRPTMIYGSPKDRNLIKLIIWLNKFPLLPIFGDGKKFMQPVHVKDLAWTIVEVFIRRNSYNQIYNISGKEKISFNNLVNTIEKLMNKKIFKIYLSWRFFYFGFKILEIIGVKMPIKSEQILRLNENKDFDHTKAKKDLNYNPMDFETGINEEIEIYKKNLEII